MDDELRKRLEQACKEYLAAYRNLEHLEMRKLMLEHDLEKVNSDIEAYSRDEEDSIASIESIWNDHPEIHEEMKEVMLPTISQVNDMEVFGE